MPERMAASGLFIVPEEHRTAVFEGLAEAERGDFAADKERPRFGKSAAYEAACKRRNVAANPAFAGTTDWGCGAPFRRPQDGEPSWRHPRAM